MGVPVYDEYIDEVGKHEAPEEMEEVRVHADAGAGRGGACGAMVMVRQASIKQAQRDGQGVC